MNLILNFSYLIYKKLVEVGACCFIVAQPLSLFEGHAGMLLLDWFDGDRNP